MQGLSFCQLVQLHLYRCLLVPYEPRPLVRVPDKDPIDLREHLFNLRGTCFGQYSFSPLTGLRIVVNGFLVRVGPLYVG